MRGVLEVLCAENGLLPILGALRVSHTSSLLSYGFGSLIVALPKLNRDAAYDDETRHFQETWAILNDVCLSIQHGQSSMEKSMAIDVRRSMQTSKIHCNWEIAKPDARFVACLVLILNEIRRAKSTKPPLATGPEAIDVVVDVVTGKILNALDLRYFSDSDRSAILELKMKNTWAIQCGEAIEGMTTFHSPAGQSDDAGPSQAPASSVKASLRTFLRKK
jgi:hypothetical protein